VEGAADVVQVVKHVPNKYDIPSSNPSTSKKKKEKKRKEKEKETINYIKLA
jgi:hypothetical protein